MNEHALADSPYVKRGKQLRSTSTEKLAIRLLVTVFFLVVSCRLIWWHYETLPPTPRKVKYKQTTPCKNLAKAIEEPYTSEYHYRPKGVSIKGKVWADYNWPGNISYSEFIQPLARDPLAYHRFKIIDNQLYHVRNPAGYRLVPGERQAKIMNMLLMTLALYNIPDVDFLMDLEDHQQHGDGPQISFAFFNKNKNPRGFTAPSSTAFFESLGHHQMDKYQQCLHKHHKKAGKRTPKAVWRGTWWRGQYKDIPRPRLARLAATAKNITDIKIIRIMKCNSQFCLSAIPEDTAEPLSDVQTVASEEFSPGDDMSSEDYNDFAFVVDLDGIGFSGRFGELLMSNTPILKQDTLFPEYFWSDFQKKNPGLRFSQDLSDFIPTLNRELELWRANPTKYTEEYLQRMHDFARTHFSHHGVARATAYALTVYAEKITWVPTLEEGFFRVQPDWSVMPHLPLKFVERIKQNSRKWTTGT